MLDPETVGEIITRLDDFERRVGDHQRSEVGHRERLEASVAKINGNVAKISAEIGVGIPEPDERNGRPTIRDRLHTLEGARDAATAVNAALALIFGRVGKAILYTGAVLGTLFAILNFFGVGG